MTKVRCKKKVDKCLRCFKEFKHFNYDNQKYCSKECADNRLKVEAVCQICGKPLLRPKSQTSRNEKNYCSRECYNLRSDAIRRLKRGTTFWRNLLNGSKCECGEDRVYLLQIHHVDGNHHNNSKNNLEIVCPTCHTKRHLKKDKSGNWVYHPKSLTDRTLLNTL